MPRRVGLRTEVALAAIVSAVLAIAMTWPVAAHLTTKIPGDLGDPLVSIYLMGWNGHALVHEPWNIFSPNAGWPFHNALAFTDTLIGLGPFAIFGGGPGGVLAAYNVVFLLAFTGNAFGGYLLTRQLGAHPVAAAFAGLVLAYTPWRFTHIGHINYLFMAAIPLALAFLARGHGFRLDGVRGPVRPGWAVAGWLFACWQLTIAFGPALPFTYVLVIIAIVALIGWIRQGRPRWDPRLLRADLGGAIAFVIVGIGLAIPYLQVRSEYPEVKRTLAWIDLYSAPPQGLLVGPRDGALWGSVSQAMSKTSGFLPAEMSLFVGLTALVLGIVGLIWSVWAPRWRVMLGLAALFAALLSLGTTGPGAPLFRILYNTLPGWNGSRTPGRLVFYLAFALAVSGAGLVTLVLRRAREIRPDWAIALRIGSIVACLLVLAEGVTTIKDVAVPPAADLSRLEAPVFVLPSNDVTDAMAVEWTLKGLPTSANWAGGTAPSELGELRAATTNPLSAGSLAAMRQYGIRSFVINKHYKSDWADPGNDRLTALGLRRVELGPEAIGYVFTR